MAANPISSILAWLRGSYPEGVAPSDFPPLLALLSRTLTPAELEHVFGELMAEHPDASIRVADIREEITKVTSAPPDEAQVRAVAARLALAGWPLAGPETTSRVAFITRVANWLRAGYPQGVPTPDQLPVVALLRRRMSDGEVARIAGELTSGASGEPISEIDAKVLISKITHDLPQEQDLERVRVRLAEQGWPLDEEL